VKANRDKNVCHRHQHCFNNFKDYVYAIPAWGGFLPADLKSHINGFFTSPSFFSVVNLSINVVGLFEWAWGMGNDAKN